MKKFMVVFSLLFMPACMFAGTFSITPYGGATEPLSPGDQVDIIASVGFLNDVLSSVEFRFYHSGIYLGNVSNPTNNVQIVGDNAIGQATLDVGAFPDANEVELVINSTHYGVPPLYHWPSQNKLAVAPTEPFVPTLHVSGLILLLAALSFILFWKR